MDNHKTRALGVFTLAMINVSAIVSLRNLPLMATHGLASVFFYLAASLLFFIPIAFVAAELATGWPQQGGVYAWVKEAFGEKVGFLAIWLEWIESVVWLPTVLSFVAATAAYVINPELAQNKYFILGTMLLVLWGLSIFNFLGIESSSWMSSLGVLFGTIVPGSLIIILSIIWVLSGKPIAMPVTMSSFVPSLHFDNIVFLNGVLLGFAGIEVAAFHAREAKDPQHTYSRAIFLATIIILSLSVLGSLAIAVVIPKHEISLIAGLMQAFSVFFGYFNLSKIVPFIAALALLGAMALLNSWIIGPSKGLLASAQHGNLPKIFTKTNRFGSPINILISQAIIGSTLSLIFLTMPSVNSSYWVITVLTSQLILGMYFLIFITGIKLRFTRYNTKRSFKIPGGNIGMLIIAGIGALTCVLSIILGFVPPADYGITNPWQYAGMLLLGIVIFSVVPMLVFKALTKDNLL